MAYPVMPLGFLGSQGDNDSYKIERSLRFNSADSAYLSRTPASAGNRKTWTWSGWVKRGIGTNWVIFSAVSDVNNATLLRNFGDVLDFSHYISSSFNGRLTTSSVFRDYSAWYHIIAVFDTPNATAGNRMRLYVNGSELTTFSADTTPTQNSDGVLNSTSAHYLGVDIGFNNQYMNGYLAEVHFIDGQALTPSSFGETDPITGRWKAKAYSGTYGTNGFYLKFADNSGTTSTTLGKDSSGNGNNWTPNNFSITAGAGNDSLVDSPTNYGTDTGLGGEVRGNYCTLNYLDNGGLTLTNGNLRADRSSASWVTCRANFAINYGKWYWEYATSTYNSNQIGICRDSTSLSGYIGQYSTGYGYNSADGNKYNNGSNSAYGSMYDNGDVVGIAFDADNGKLFFSKNGVWQASGNPATGANPAYSSLTSYPYFPAFSIYGTVTANCNFGQRPFAYIAPTGFKALCTQNLPQPTIQKPSTAMDVVTYTGTGASQSISGLGFSPDLVWIKGRSGATDHALYDVIRGSQARLESNNTDAEVTSDNGLTSFDTYGFTVGTLAQVNTSTATYVGWAWDAGSTNSTNTSGSITSTVRANPQAGFSIVSYTGTGANATVGHGLGVSPSMMIFKNRTNSGDSWDVYHKSNGNTKEIFLSSTAAATTSTTAWNSTSPTSSVFSIGARDDVNRLNGSFIAYCFAEIEGYSKFGSYTGNGSADGPFVYCGFRPRWVMVKRTDTAIENWQIQDSIRSTSNPAQNNLFPNLSQAEQVGGADRDFDFVSNGFKLRGNNTGTNASGGTYIFAAFAESPFKYARAR